MEVERGEEGGERAHREKDWAQEGEEEKEEAERKGPERAEEDG